MIRRVPPPRRRHPPARHLGQGARVDLHARHRAARAGARARRCRSAARSAPRSAAGCGSARASGASCMVAGVAAGIAAVFRTPLGAALLAIEVLYRDDFESDALIPAVLASVVAYSVVISVLRRVDAVRARAALSVHRRRTCRSTRCSRSWSRCSPSLFVCDAPARRSTLRATAARSRSGRGPASAGSRSALLAVPIICVRRRARRRRPGRALGILGGGYGAAQVAITGADWLPGGWRGVELLALALRRQAHRRRRSRSARGGSAGDFAPSLVLGGLFGGAFGRAAQLVLARSAHRSRRLRARRHGHVLRRHRARRRSARWSWSASSPAATTCSCR